MGQQSRKSYKKMQNNVSAHKSPKHSSQQARHNSNPAKIPTMPASVSTNNNRSCVNMLPLQLQFHLVLSSIKAAEEKCQARADEVRRCNRMSRVRFPSSSQLHECSLACQAAFEGR
jgi:hypothetical protein